MGNHNRLTQQRTIFGATHGEDIRQTRHICHGHIAVLTAQSHTQTGTINKQIEIMLTTKS